MPQYNLKDGTSTSDRRLDRIPAFDERSRNFPVTASLNAEQQKPVSNAWTAPTGTPVLDQGQEGACTGYGVTNELLWNPVPVPGLDGTFAREQIYWVAQRDDTWPGGSYPGAEPKYEGTAVLYAVKAAADLGYYTEYRWATTESAMALGVSHLGPAIIGVNWYNKMFTPDAKNFVHPTGGVAGGHCLLVTAINVEDGYYTLHNSWGPTWGDNGNCKIKRTDMAKLLREQGDCCIITGRSMPQPSKAEAEHAADDILPETH